MSFGSLCSFPDKLRFLIPKILMENTHLKVNIKLESSSYRENSISLQNFQPIVLLLSSQLLKNTTWRETFYVGFAPKKLYKASLKNPSQS